MTKLIDVRYFLLGLAAGVLAVVATREGTAR
jgi:hypothetical protein